MHAHLEHVLAGLDQSRAALRDAVSSVPAHVRNRRPGADRWSVVDILEHLSLAEVRFTSFVSTAIAAAREAGLAEETEARTPLPDKIVGIMADRVNRRDAPDLVRPRGGIDEAQAWEAVDRTREAFRAALLAADGLALNQVVHAHPSLGPLTAYQWAELVARHEARHVEQIREVAAHFTQAV